jgi:hypothetical protein
MIRPDTISGIACKNKNLSRIQSDTGGGVLPSLPIVSYHTLFLKKDTDDTAIRQQADYDACLADIEAAYPGINDDGSCPHGEPYDRCPTCSPPEPQDMP